MVVTRSPRIRTRSSIPGDGKNAPCLIRVNIGHSEAQLDGERTAKLSHNVPVSLTAKLLIGSAASHLLLFFCGLVPPGWIETVHARGVFPRLRYLFATPVASVSFSIVEILLSCGILLAGATLLQLLLPRQSRISLLPQLLLLLSVLGLHLYLLGFGWLYKRPPLARRLSLPELSDQESFAQGALEAAGAARRLRCQAPEELRLAELGLLAREAVQAVLPLLDAEPLPASRLKAVWPEGFLLRFGVSGIFSPFTQETHIDLGIDPVERPFVAAHELAHLAGFASEDEANFVAWLACSRSEDPWFRYSGQLAALRRFHAKAAIGLRKELMAKAGPDVLADWRRAAERRGSHRSVPLSKINRWAYDKLLRSQGVEEGIRSCDAVTRLMLAWRAHILRGAPSRER